MPKRVAEVGEGNEEGSGVYSIIRDLIIEGKDARFVNKKGRYVINWSRALDCFTDYKTKKNPQFKSKAVSRRKVSNGFRSALLNYYKKEGAKEYKDSKKVNENDEVVERQFQMPPRLFKSLFKDAPVTEDSEDDDQDTSSVTSESDIKAEMNHSSSTSDTGFDELMDMSSCDFSGTMDPLAGAGLLVGDVFPVAIDLGLDVTKTAGEEAFNLYDALLPSAPQDTLQMIETSALDSAIEEICSDGISDDISDEGIDLLGVVQDICPTSGSVKGGFQFYISLTEELPNEVRTGVAQFEGVASVTVYKLNPFTLTGTVPASQEPGEVPVSIITDAGRKLGMTCFRYIDEMREMIRQIVNDPTLQSLWFTMWSQENGFFGNDNNVAQVLGTWNIEGQDSSLQAKQQISVKVLQLLVYTAAQTDAQEFIEMVFGTSAGQVVFNSYKDKTPLPEDVAQANGHEELAQYLRDINTRLSKETIGDAQSLAIDWLELVNTVQKQSSHGESAKQLDQLSESDDTSDYFADVETSSCGSSDHDTVASDQKKGSENRNASLCRTMDPTSQDPCVDKHTSGEVHPAVATMSKHDQSNKFPSKAPDGSGKRNTDVESSQGPSVGAVMVEEGTPKKIKVESETSLNVKKDKESVSHWGLTRVSRDPCTEKQISTAVHSTMSEHRPSKTFPSNAPHGNGNRKTDGESTQGTSVRPVIVEEGTPDRTQVKSESSLDTEKDKESVSFWGLNLNKLWTSEDAPTISQGTSWYKVLSNYVFTSRGSVTDKADVHGASKPNMAKPKESNKRPSRARSSRKTEATALKYKSIVLTVALLTVLAGFKLKEGQILHWAVGNGYTQFSKILLQCGMYVDVPGFLGETPLHLAAKNGFRDLVDVLVRSGGDVNARNFPMQETPLHLAIRNGHRHITEFLIQRGSLVNATNVPMQETPLHLAARNGHKQIAELLIRRGSQVNARNAPEEETPLHLAAENGHGHIVELLVQQGSQVNARNAPWHKTPLHLASRNGHQQVAELLIQHGGHVNARDGPLQETPLHLAARNGHQRIVEVLLQHGGNIDARNEMDSDSYLVWSACKIGYICPYHETPLHLASRNGHQQIAAMLIQRGALVNAESSPYHETPLHLASRNGHQQIAMLIQRGALVNAESSPDHETPLHLASRSGHQQIAEFLIQHGSQVDARNEKRQTPLHLAARNGHQDVVKVLIQYGSDVSDINKLKEASPFYFSTPRTWGANYLFQIPFDQVSRNYQRSIVAFLKVNAKNSPHRETPLNLSVRNDHKQIAEFLIDHGNDVCTRNIPFQETPLHLTAKNGGCHIAERLIQHSSNINGQNYEKEVPLHLVARNGHQEEIAEFIIRLKINITNVPGQERPLHLASKWGYYYIPKNKPPTRFKVLFGHCGSTNGQFISQLTILESPVKDSKVQVAELLIQHESNVSTGELGEDFCTTTRIITRAKSKYFKKIQWYPVSCFRIQAKTQTPHVQCNERNHTECHVDLSLMGSFCNKPKQLKQYLCHETCAPCLDFSKIITPKLGSSRCPLSDYVDFDLSNRKTGKVLLWYTDVLGNDSISWTLVRNCSVVLAIGCFTALSMVVSYVLLSCRKQRVHFRLRRNSTSSLQETRAYPSQTQELPMESLNPANEALEGSVDEKTLGDGSVHYGCIKKSLCEGLTHQSVSDLKTIKIRMRDLSNRQKTKTTNPKMERVIMWLELQRCKGISSIENEGNHFFSVISGCTDAGNQDSLRKNSTTEFRHTQSHLASLYSAEVRAALANRQRFVHSTRNTNGMALTALEAKLHASDRNSTDEEECLEDLFDSSESISGCTDAGNQDTIRKNLTSEFRCTQSYLAARCSAELRAALVDRQRFSTDDDHSSTTTNGIALTAPEAKLHASDRNSTEEEECLEDLLDSSEIGGRGFEWRVSGKKEDSEDLISQDLKECYTTAICPVYVTQSPRPPRHIKMSKFSVVFEVARVGGGSWPMEIRSFAKTRAQCGVLSNLHTATISECHGVILTNLDKDLNCSSFLTRLFKMTKSSDVPAMKTSSGYVSPLHAPDCNLALLGCGSWRMRIRSIDKTGAPHSVLSNLHTATTSPSDVWDVWSASRSFCTLEELAKPRQFRSNLWTNLDEDSNCLPFFAAVSTPSDAQWYIYLSDCSGPSSGVLVIPGQNATSNDSSARLQADQPDLPSGEELLEIAAKLAKIGDEMHSENGSCRVAAKYYDLLSCNAQLPLVNMEARAQIQGRLPCFKDRTVK